MRSWQPLAQLTQLFRSLARSRLPKPILADAEQRKRRRAVPTRRSLFSEFEDPKNEEKLDFREFIRRHVRVAAAAPPSARETVPQLPATGGWMLGVAGLQRAAACCFAWTHCLSAQTRSHRTTSVPSFAVMSAPVTLPLRSFAVLDQSPVEKKLDLLFDVSVAVCRSPVVRRCGDIVVVGRAKWREVSELCQLPDPHSHPSPDTQPLTLSRTQTRCTMFTRAVPSQCRSYSRSSTQIATARTAAAPALLSGA